MREVGGNQPTIDRPWAIEAEAVAQALGTDLASGLSRTEVPLRLGPHRRNEVLERGHKPPWRLLVEQFTNTMIVVLMIAAIVTAIIGDLKDTIVILAIVALNGVISFVQEYRAEQAMAALKRMTSPSARVVRDGVVGVVSATEIVPGDLLRLEAGDVVAADLRRLGGGSLRINEAALTRESKPP